MKTELISAAATLAAVALQKRVEAKEDITEELMASALTSAYRAILQAQFDWIQAHPTPPMSKT